MAIVRATQPQTYPRVNWANPLTRGICFALAGGGAAPFTDCVSGRFGTPSGSSPPTASATTVGVLPQFNHAAVGAGGVSSLNFSTHPACVDLGINPTTWAFYARSLATSTGSFGGMAERNDGNTVSAGWAIQKLNTGTLEFVRENSAVNFQVQTTGTPWTDGSGFHSIVVTHTGSGTLSGLAIYFDGVAQALTQISAGSGTSGSDAAFNLYFGRTTFNNNVTLDWDLAAAVFVKRVWSDAEVNSFTRNPFQLFSPQLTRRSVISAAGLTAAVGQVTETDLAQAITKIKRVTTGQNIETDLAQGITRAKARTLGLVTGVQTAQAITRRKSWVLTQAAEMSVAQAVVGPKRKPLPQVVETQTAQVVGKAKRHALAQVTATEVAQVVSVRKHLALVTLAETDLAQAIDIVLSGVKVAQVGRAIEAESVQAVSRRKVVTLGQVEDLGQAQVISRKKSVSLVELTETQTAQGIAKTKRHALTQVTTIEVAQVIAKTSPRTILQAAELAVAQAVTRTKHHVLAQASVAEAAQGITSAKRRALVQATETEAALVLARVRIMTVVEAAEIETVQLIARAKRHALGRTVEFASARTIIGFPQQILPAVICLSDKAQTISLSNLAQRSVVTDLAKDYCSADQ